MVAVIETELARISVGPKAELERKSSVNSAAGRTKIVHDTALATLVPGGTSGSDAAPATGSRK